jgi:hypothetical protein
MRWTRERLLEVKRVEDAMSAAATATARNKAVM